MTVEACETVCSTQFDKSNIVRDNEKDDDDDDKKIVQIQYAQKQGRLGVGSSRILGKFLNLERQVVAILPYEVRYNS